MIDPSLHGRIKLGKGYFTFAIRLPSVSQAAAEIVDVACL
jgi:hypothetical protein